MKHLRKIEHHTKPLLLTLLCIMLVCVIGGGSTLAYYSALVGEKTNVFTFSEDIRADLLEPNWNPVEGLKLVPGKQVAKDPMIENTCAMSEYAAIKLTFQYTDDDETPLRAADYTRLMNSLVIDWNVGAGSTQWTAISGAGTRIQTYVYNKELSAGEISAPVINSIRVKTKAEGLTEAELRWLQAIKIVDGEIVADTAGLGGFDIKVEGAVVQAEAFASPTAATTALTSLFS